MSSSNHTYRINEIFSSIQGEGYYAGTPATFIRLQGCPVGCDWCDTKYTWGAGGVSLSVEQIMKKVDEYHIVITGGEPMLWDLDLLLKGLQGHYVQIETSGLNWYKGKLRAKWITWSPKPKLNFDAPDALIRSAREVKFVVTPDIRLDTIMGVWNKVLSLHKSWDYPYVMLMPEGTPPTEESMQRALELLRLVDIRHRPKFANLWRVSDRIHYRFGVK